MQQDPKLYQKSKTVPACVPVKELELCNFLTKIIVWG